MKKHLLTTLFAFSLLNLTSLEVMAASITPTNLDDLSLGERIVGPVGSEVNTSLINADNNSLGDLNSSVSCPVGFSECVPPVNPPGTIYTYIHEVTPGDDFDNDDPPFIQPEILLPFDNVREFSLGFEAFGFTGVAGYSFDQATTALETGEPIQIELENGRLIWTVPEGWGTGETISFFWQTLQPPSGPGGVYTASNNTQIGSGRGPLPLEVQTVPESRSSWGLIVLAGAILVTRRLIKYQQ